MKSFILCFFIFLSKNLLNAQEAKLSVGIEMGLIKNWSTIPIDEVGVFINTQDYQYNTRENFQNVYITYEKTYGARMDFFRGTYSDLICAQGNISLDANVKDCSGTDWNAYQVNFNVFRKLYFLNRRMFFSPTIGAGYMWYGGDLYSLGNDGGGSTRGSLFNYYYDLKVNNLRNKNVVLNSGLSLGYKINPKLSLSIYYNYQQGLLMMYQIDIVAWKPDDYKVYERPTDLTKLMNAQINSRGTNSHFGLGLEYNLKSYPSKKIHR
jgi:hypothetical protein